jgi:nitrate reductase assembly molybdenum cofactor insertion protein NarJ
MRIENAIRRAQVYGFLVDAFLYPCENWTEDVPLVTGIVQSLGWITVRLDLPVVGDLSELQAAHRHTFGMAGSLCYETEYGLPHEYRQSQEMADIAGFYRAFGFNLGGEVRERPDHIAVELEFMHTLALKEAYALEKGTPEQVGICQLAQAKFLEDHLGHWIELYAQAVAHNSVGHNSVGHNAPDTLFTPLARFTADFIRTDADRLGVSLPTTKWEQVQHTPYDPDFSCATCELGGMAEPRSFVRADSIQ